MTDGWAGSGEVRAQGFGVQGFGVPGVGVPGVGVPGVGVPVPGVRRARVVGVVGARGGAGASTFAAALAAGLSRRTATCLVDLDHSCSGIEVALGVEGVAGARWPDLAGARGAVDGAEVLALLPRHGRCAVLSADRRRPVPPAADVVASVLRALAGVCGAVVLDLDARGVVEGSAPVTTCDQVLVVAPRDLRSVAGVVAMGGALREVAQVGLVVHGPAPGGMGAAELARAVGVPLVGVLRRRRGAAVALEHGGAPDRRTVREAERLARAVLAAA